MRLTPKVKEILSWYESDNPGVKTNLARLLMHGRLAGSGKLVILPVDQGFEHGPARSFAPNPAAYDPRYLFELAIEAGLSAYAAPLGPLEAGAVNYAGEVPLILKLNSANSLAGGNIGDQALTASVDDALRLGCVGVGFTMYPGLRRLLRHAGGAKGHHPGSQGQGSGAGGLVLSARRQDQQGRRDRARYHRLRGAHGGADGGHDHQGQAAQGRRRPGRGKAHLRQGRGADGHAVRARRRT